MLSWQVEGVASAFHIQKVYQGKFRYRQKPFKETVSFLSATFVLRQDVQTLITLFILVIGPL